MKYTPIFATVALAGLLIVTASQPAAAQRQRQFSNGRGGSITGTVEASQNENGGINRTRSRITNTWRGGSAEYNSRLETSGDGSFTRYRDRVLTGSQGNSVTCSSTTTGIRGSGIEYQGSCNP